MEKRGLPWFRLLAEAVLIVVSILAAFAIDAWWAQSQESEKLAQEAFDAGVRTLGEEHATTRDLANTLARSATSTAASM